MSTTLSVWHVLMAGPGRGVDLPGGAGHLMLPGGQVLPALDPLLRDFWSVFPCPPPWNHGLLFRVNWTACVGQAMGERLKWFLADRCNIPHDGLGLIPGVDEDGKGGDDEGELEVPDVCSTPCIIMIALAFFIFSLLLAALVFCVCRKRPKASSPNHQSPLNAHTDNAKYYTSCHYASAPVMPRPLETTLRGDNRAETRVMSSAGSHHYHYDKHHHHHHHHHQQQQQQQQQQQHYSPYHQQHEHRPLVTPQHGPHARRTRNNYSQQAHLNPVLVHVSGQTAVVLPRDVPDSPQSGVLLGGSRGLEGVGGGGGGGDYMSSNSSASHTYSDRSHTYETIGDVHPFNDCYDNGSAKGGAGEPGGSGGVGKGLGVRVYAHANPRATVLSKDADLCDCEYGMHYDCQLSSQSDDYGSEYNSHTLPVRHFRHVMRDQNSPFGGSYSFDIDDGLSPPGGPESLVSNRSRRRLSASSHYSDGSQKDGRKRTIPALHPNYFDPPEPPAPDTFS